MRRRFIVPLLLLVAPLFGQDRGNRREQGSQPLPQSEAAEPALPGADYFRGAGAANAAAAPRAGALAFSNYKMGPEDLLAVTVLDSPEFTRQVRVSGDGTIRMPLLKRAIPAAGKTSAELEQAISRQLVEEGMLVDPSVSVTVLEFNSKPVSVSGAVRSPVVFQAVKPLSLVEAIARASGLAENAGSDILISVPARDGRPARTVTVPVKALQQPSDPGANFLLEGGEEVKVTPAGLVYIVGGVNKPGAVLMNTEGPFTLLKALALSGGTTPTAGSKAFLLRNSANGQKKEIALNLTKLMRRQEPDLPLENNDVVFIPDSTMRKISQTGMSSAVSAVVFAMGTLILR
jgi:polysaccharide export outer membrane protein